MNNTLLKLALVSALAITTHNSQANAQDMMIATTDPITGEIIYVPCPTLPLCPAAATSTTNLEDNN